MSTSPISVLTASFGDGHNSAARSVAAELTGRGTICEGPTDLLMELFPATMAACSKGYRKVITRWPNIWRGLYSLAERAPLGGEGLDLLAPVTRGFARYLRDVQPCGLVSTYPLYGHLLQRVFGPGRSPIPLLTVVTDSRSINHAWLNQAGGHFAVLDRASARYFLENGIPADRVHVTGFPVDPQFAAMPPGEAESSLPEPLSILYTASTRESHVIECLREIELACATLNVRLTVVLGRNADRLGDAVAAMVPPTTTILGWTDGMPELLCSHHLLIGKAGGASVQETLAAGCPMLVNYIVPGQEEGNAELLTASGAGAVADSPVALGATLKRLLENSGHGWLSMRRAARRNSRPGAAATIADLVESLVNSSDH